MIVLALVCSCGTEPDTPPGQQPPPGADVADTLAFQRDGSIYITGVEEGAQSALLDSGFVSPSWSPDGNTLSMVQIYPPDSFTFDPSAALFLADADGGNVRQLTSSVHGIEGAAVWAPDGRDLLFVRDVNGLFPASMYVARVPADSGLEVRVGASRIGVSGSWSRDGSLIAVDPYTGLEIYDAATMQVQYSLGIRWITPRFSPVNDELAFRDESGGLHVIRPDGTANRGLGVAGSPHSWSPDGARLAFYGVDGLYTIATDGSGLSRIAPLYSSIAWSPDGSRIAYVPYANTSPDTLYVASPDGSDRRVLQTGEGLCCAAWKPR
jgi:Tol biopolymer transport system component